MNYCQSLHYKRGSKECIYLVQGGSTAGVTGSNGRRTAAESRERDLVEEDAAEVDVGRGNEGVSNDTTAARAVGIRAVESARARVLVGDSVEDTADTGSGVGAPVGPVQRVASTTAADVRSRSLCKGARFGDTVKFQSDIGSQRVIEGRECTWR